MNIINIGGWYVGNTAVLDWMDGFSELAVIKGDMNIMRLENGIMDILATENIEEKLLIIKLLKQQCYQGLYTVSRSNVARYSKHLFKSKTKRMHSGYIRFYLMLLSYLKRFEKRVYEKVPFDEYGVWRHWLSTLPRLDSASKKYQHIIYQNPFFYDETFSGHKEIWPKLFEPYKLIFVHRDPLDQFSDIVKDGSHLSASWPRFHGDTSTMHPADRFFDICQKLYEARIRMAKHYTEDQLIIFSFEDFILNHDVVTRKLKDFLNVKSARDSSNDLFNIEKSMRNIGVGSHSRAVSELLKGREYIMETLSMLRESLKDSRCALNVER